MAKEPQMFGLSGEQRDRLLQAIGLLLKERVLWQQGLREQQEESATANEEIFLELLEVVDALEFLLNYLTDSSESISPAWQGLPKSVASVQKKLLGILEKRQVNPIDFQETKPDFSLCRVVDREMRDDLENRTILKIVRRGFRLGNKLLRPVEAIASSSTKDNKILNFLAMF
jgi:molecular chaperone GrpE